jgi:hypothetical protein
MTCEPEEQLDTIKLDLSIHTIQKIKTIANIIGFSSVEDFLKTAVKKEVDYYSMLLDYEGTEKK